MDSLKCGRKLAGDDANMRQTLERLHGLFVNAPDLGSLIDPMSVPVRERMFTPDFEQGSASLGRSASEERGLTIRSQQSLGVPPWEWHVPPRCWLASTPW